MKKTPILTAALGATLLISALAGCTSSVKTGTTETAPTPSSSTSAPTATDGKSTKQQADRLKQQTEATGKCIDGTAYIGATKTDFTLAETCDTVHVRGTGATITLGAVNHLIIENSDNTITARSVKKIVNISAGSKVTYTGAKAEINDIGTKSIFTNR